MMKASRAAPSVRAGENCLVAALANHAPDFIGDQIECTLPAHGYITIGPAPIARTARSVLEPSCPHRGLRDTAGMMQRVGNGPQQWRGIGILREGSRFRHASLGYDRLERTPMRTVENRRR